VERTWDVLYITYLVNGLAMIGLPLGLGLFLSRKLGTKWSLFALGAASFFVSQVVHLPLLYGLTALFKNKVLPSPPAAWQLLFNAVVLGLAAGLCEELARYFFLRYGARLARTWREALMFGAGHGGLEAIILGGLVLVSYVNMVALRNANLTTLGLSADQQAALAKQLAAYWSAPWYFTLLGAVERLFALCMHLSLAVMVMRALSRHNLLWLGAAILWHALADGSAVLGQGAGLGVLRIEAVVGAFALGSLVIIFALRPRQPEAVMEAAPEVVLTGAPPSPRAADRVQAEAQQQADQSKYTD
jgi:uncharacterized membrane protein YhfC